MYECVPLLIVRECVCVCLLPSGVLGYNGTGIRKKMLYQTLCLRPKAPYSLYSALLLSGNKGSIWDARRAAAVVPLVPRASRPGGNFVLPVG